MSNAKKPADHKRKRQDALDLVRAEAAKSADLAAMGERKFTIKGRRDTVTVTTLDALDWDAEVVGLLRDGDYLGALVGMLSDADGVALRAARPSIGELLVAFTESDDDGDADGELALGESQAS